MMMMMMMMILMAGSCSGMSTIVAVSLLLT
jgi:guanylate kinase